MPHQCEPRSYGEPGGSLGTCSGFRYATVTWETNCTGEGVMNGWGVALAYPGSDRQLYVPPRLNGPAYEPAPPTRDASGVTRFADGHEVGHIAIEKSIALASGTGRRGSRRRVLLVPGLRVYPYLRVVCSIRLSNGELEIAGKDVSGAMVSVAPFLELSGGQRVAAVPNVPTTVRLRLLVYERRSLDPTLLKRVTLFSAGAGVRETWRVDNFSYRPKRLKVMLHPRRAGTIRIWADAYGLKSNSITIRVR